MGDLSQYIKRRRSARSHGLPEHVVRVFLKQLGKYIFYDSTAMVILLFYYSFVLIFISHFFLVFSF